MMGLPIVGDGTKPAAQWSFNSPIYFPFSFIAVHAIGLLLKGRLPLPSLPRLHKPLLRRQGMGFTSPRPSLTTLRKLLIAELLARSPMSKSQSRDLFFLVSTALLGEEPLTLSVSEAG